MLFIPFLMLVVTASAVEESVGRQVIQACDRRLIKVIRQACEDRNYDFSAFTPMEHEHFMKYHYKPEVRPDTSLQMRDKRSLSITEACCKKTCLAKELLTYCNDE